MVSEQILGWLLPHFFLRWWQEEDIPLVHQTGLVLWILPTPSYLKWTTPEVHIFSTMGIIQVSTLFLIIWRTAIIKLGVGPCQWFSMRITNSDSSMAQFDDLLLEIFSSAHGLAASVIRSMATHLVTSLSLNLSLHHLIPTKQPWSHTTGLHPWIPDLAKFLL